VGNVADGGEAAGEAIQVGIVRQQVPRPHDGPDAGIVGAPGLGGVAPEAMNEKEAAMECQGRENTAIP